MKQQPHRVSFCGRQVIGALLTVQTQKGSKERNDRLIAVAAQSINFSNVRRLGDLGATVLKNIEAFFVNYQALRNVQVSIVGRHGPQRATRLVEKASAAWLERDPCA